MFARYLRSRLVIESREVHEAAETRLAEWSTCAGDHRAAIRHYVTAGRNDLAVACAASEVTSGLLSGGSGPDLRSLLDEIPEWYLRRDQDHMYLCAVVHLLGGQRREAARWITSLRIRLAAGGTADQLSRLEFLGAIQSAQSLDPEATLAHLERGRAMLDDPPEATAAAGAAGAAPEWLAAVDGAVLDVLPWLAARARAEMGWTEPAVALLEGRRDLVETSAGPVAASAAASVSLAGGRLGEVLAITDEVLGGTGPDRPSRLVQVEGYLARAGALLERDELRAAREAIESARSRCVDPALTAWAAMAGLMSARLSLAEGNPRSALRELVALETAPDGAAPSPAVATMIRAVEMRCHLAMGAVDSARRVLEQVPEGRRAPADMARVELAAGRPDRAAPHIERASRSATVPRQKIEALLLRARTHLQSGNLRDAEDALHRALLLARPEGYVRVFLDEPPRVLEALRDLHRRDGDEFLGRLVQKVANGDCSGHCPTGPPRMAEALTTRERELIGYLPSHYSQGEIARSLHISSNTVKTHMKSLYRKLGARSRSEAVELARSYGLLPDTEIGTVEHLGGPLIHATAS